MAVDVVFAGRDLDGAAELFVFACGASDNFSDDAFDHAGDCNSGWSRRQESNLDLSLRRAEFYPLKYSECALVKTRGDCSGFGFASDKNPVL